MAGENLLLRRFHLLHTLKMLEIAIRTFTTHHFTGERPFSNGKSGRPIGDSFTPCEMAFRLEYLHQTTHFITTDSFPQRFSDVALRHGDHCLWLWPWQGERLFKLWWGFERDFLAFVAETDRQMRERLSVVEENLFVCLE